MTTDTDIENKDCEQPSDVKVGETAPPPKCCKCFHFGGEKTAIGSNYLGAARGAMVMSNIFLSTSFLYLASQDAGCLTEETPPRVDKGCETRVYGFLPIAFISNIAVISGLISAFCMPVIGSIVDYTNYRTLLGIMASVLLCIVQAIQIGTVLDTYFIMAILQAIAGFLFQVIVLAVYSFLPYIARIVGKDSMRTYTATWTITQFSSQGIFLLVMVIVTGFVLKTDAVRTAQIGQSLSIAWTAPLFYFGWKLFPKMPKSRELPEGHSLLTEGFKQNWRTIKSINTRYKKSLRWYFLALVFAEAGTNTFTIVANVFLIEALGMNATQVGIFFMITLLFALPGCKLGEYVTMKTNPNISWRLAMLCLAIVADVGVFLLDSVPRESNYLGFVWGACIGIFIGWFYPTENYFFSLIVPKEQEAEMAGFFVYCSQILGWLPPLIFSIIVENGYNQKWGVLAVTGFQAVAIGILSLQGPWSEVINEKDEEEFSPGRQLTEKEDAEAEADSDSDDKLLENINLDEENLSPEEQREKC